MIIDEVYERIFYIDVLFGLVKDIVRFRFDFKFFIFSVILDVEKFFVV